VGLCDFMIASVIRQPVQAQLPKQRQQEIYSVPLVSTIKTLSIGL